MADPVVPTPAQNEAGPGAPSLAPPPPPTPGTQSQDPTGPSYEPRPGPYDQYNAQYVEPFLKQYINSFSTDQGKERALEQANQLRMHFYQKEQADQSTLAGEQAVTDTESTINGFATLARNDPSSSDLAMQMAVSHIKSVATGNPNLSADDAARLTNSYAQKAQQQVALAHYYGLANRTPQVALDELKQGRYLQYLPQGAAEAIEMHANENIRLQAEGLKAQQEALDKAGKEQFKQLSTAAVMSMFQPDGSIAINKDTYANLQQLSQHPYADPSEMKSLVGMAAEARKANIEGSYVSDDPATLENFKHRMLLPVTAPGALTNGDVYAAVVNKRLSMTTARELIDARDKVANDPEERLMRSNIQRVTDQLKSSITNANPLTGNIDPLGSQHYAQFLANVERRVTTMRNQGIPASQIEKELIDPNSPISIFKEVANYIPSKAQSQKAITDWANGGLPPQSAIYDPYVSASSSAKVAAASPTGSVSAAAWLAARAKAQQQKPAPPAPAGRPR